jgi:hypothetical protein
MLLVRSSMTASPVYILCDVSSLQADSTHHHKLTECLTALLHALLCRWLCLAAAYGNHAAVPQRSAV